MRPRVIGSLLCFGSFVARPAMNATINQTLVQQESRCSEDRPITVSRDSIGPLPVGASIIELKRICPASAIDRTRRHLSDGYSTPVVVFPFDSAEVVGQFDDMTKDVIDSADHLDLFRITGKVLLPGGVSSATPWALLAKEGGEGTMRFSSAWVQVSFKRWPGIVFAYRLYNNATRPLPVSEGKGYIPSEVIPSELRLHRRVTKPSIDPNDARSSATI